MPSWIYDQAEVVLTVLTAVIAGIWYGSRWTTRIETVVEHGFENNSREHETIVEKLDDHSERLAGVEAKVEDHRNRYP